MFVFYFVKKRKRDQSFSAKEYANNWLKKSEIIMPIQDMKCYNGWTRGKVLDCKDAFVISCML